ncbi:PAP2 superfamily-domain-containing protein [Suillus subalutaceus]|uniref:PAP2 superfamily-domain-containing protein n=1 Tax=Suillus subalutaceus TaxID=48586 RepID=UPI001B85BA8D|nr:PAP2 superfamily-domain-containing protein [Suillus subalutaceus]KAG1833654.1 PAP2 superfamily-domain-containing protein [Suillus subalutaceus]
MMSTQASNTHALPSVTFRDEHAHNKKPIFATYHDKLEHSQLDKQGRTDAPCVVDVYETELPWWRATIRARILSSVKRESLILARMQERIRHPWLDLYFLYSSTLGTQTFFMIGLPLAFFFGYEEFGRGLVIVLASGVYIVSFLKDLICSPRPLAPPVTRLTIGMHHLEYGFPSTHSANSVSMALFIFGYVRSAYIQSNAISSSIYYGSCVILVIYAVTIVFGRLYTAMHSFTDCAVGVFLGVVIWGAYVIMKETFGNWLATAHWIVPLTMIPICLLLVHYHPHPVDDCPCFEDAIAFASVFLGIALCRWHSVRSGIDERFLSSVMPGPQGTVWTWEDTASWWALACAKVTVGILAIFVWRILAKSLLHLVLPPLFRLLASSFDLPHRRFYTPATDYQHMPVESSLRPIPSVIDLPGVLAVSTIRERSALGRTSEVKRRGVKSNDGSPSANGENYSGSELENSNGPSQRKEVKHYDADVLTKVVVYAGMAILAGEGLPVTFALLGWGVKPQ